MASSIPSSQPLFGISGDTIATFGSEDRTHWNGVNRVSIRGQKFWYLHACCPKYSEWVLKNFPTFTYHEGNIKAFYTYLKQQRSESYSKLQSLHGHSDAEYEAYKRSLASQS